ncbi:MAG: DUF4360 domain-containing protein [Pseudobdellovibrionaceae bacterium]|jgi:hypothetical protein
MKLSQLMMIAGLLVMTTAAEAQLRLGEPAYGGSGCPAGSAAVTVSPDEQAISVLFDQYTVEAGRTTGRRLDRKNCNLTIPVQVPQGYSVSVFQVDYRGYLAVPRGGMARFDAEYFWAGSRGPRLSRQFNGPTNDLFTLTDELLARTLVWTRCGESVNLRVNTSILVQANSNMDQTLGQVDSADVSSGVIYHLQWKRCN